MWLDHQDVTEILSNMVLKLCRIAKVCHSTVEVLVQEVINSAGVLKAALSGMWNSMLCDSGACPLYTLFVIKSVKGTISH